MSTTDVDAASNSSSLKVREGSILPSTLGARITGQPSSPRRRRFADGKEMTPEMLVDACLQHDGYEQPNYNTVLYLQYKMVKEIKNLEPYVQLRALYLENNGITRISGLACIPQLRSLYLQNNLIRKIEGLERLQVLDSLNL